MLQYPQGGEDMKSEKIVVSAICVLLNILGLFFAAHYFNVYMSNTRHGLYAVFAIFAIAEALFTGVSFYLYLKDLKNRFVSAIYVISTIFAIPILVITAFWILYFAGMQIPPQLCDTI